MDKLPIDLQLETGIDGKLTLVDTDVGEPEKAFIVERAMELAAIEGRPERPDRNDFERAARELSADAEYMDRGGRDLGDVGPETDLEEGRDARDASEARGDGTSQSPMDDGADEASDPARLVRRGVEDADNEQMLEGRKKHGVSADKYREGEKP